MLESISVVIPVFNSENSLNELYGKLTYELEMLCSDFEIILVDDGSYDNSLNCIKALHLSDSRVKVIQLDGNFGQQNALMCGFHYAIKDFVITMDDDLQNPPKEIKKLIKKLSEGYDVVYGIPLKKRHTFYRKLGTKMTDIFFNLVCGKPINVKICSFRALTKEIVRKILEDKRSFIYISAITFKNTKNVTSVVVTHNYRKYGKSNYNIIKLLCLYKKLFIYYSPFISSSIKTKGPQFIVKQEWL